MPSSFLRTGVFCATKQSQILERQQQVYLQDAGTISDEQRK